MLNFKSKLITSTFAILVSTCTLLPTFASAAVVVSNTSKKICSNYDPFADKYKKENGAKYNDPGVPAGHQYLAKGTVVPVKLLQTLDSKTAKTNQIVKLQTTDNVYYNGYVVIPRYTPVTGYVYVAHKGGGFGQKGVLKVAGLELVTGSGFKVPLMDGIIGRGKNDGGAVAVAAAVTVIGGAFMKGTNVTIEEGTEFEVKVRSNTDLGY